MKQGILFLVAAIFAFQPGYAQILSGNADQLKSIAFKDLDGKYDFYKKIALQIGDYAELGFKEVKSSGLLESTLKDNGFTIQTGVAGMPTAFVASYGSGKPVIAFLAEYDALPGMSQAFSAEKTSIEGQAAGHACGHNLLGTGSVAAAIEIKQLIAAKKLSGTIKVFGCPAEEGGSGKVYLVRAGLFNDVDIVLHWHPDAQNNVMATSSLANISAKFRFHGLAAHAAAEPEKGRSALDAVEGMDYLVNMMREHIPQETRIHYIITNGGQAPNIVPDFAESYYYVRHPDKEMVKAIFERVTKAAQGAALGTGTTVDYEIIGGVHDLLLNKTLEQALQVNLEKVGGLKYNAAETLFAQKLQQGFKFKAPPISTADSIPPLEESKSVNSISTDVGDVSYAVPTAGVYVASWVPGTVAHSWQAAACSLSEIGTQGMMIAVKTLTFTAIDLFQNPKLIQEAKEEFVHAKGDYHYQALLGDRQPALNYRN